MKKQLHTIIIPFRNGIITNTLNLLCLYLFCCFSPFTRAADLTSQGSEHEENHVVILLAFGCGILLTLLALRLYKHLISRRTVAQFSDNVSIRFLEKITHETRNHLAGIQLVASNLLARETTSDKTRKLEAILHETFQTQLFLDNCLIYTQLQHHPIKLQDNNVDISPILSTLVEENSPLQYQNKQPNTPLFIRGNAFLLKTAFHNLIDNACKFSKGAQAPVLSLRHHDTHVEIQLIDYGKGIAPDLIEQVFMPKGLSGENSNNEELAWGLFIAKQVIESHQGTILLHSNESTGTTIIVTLPLTS